MRGRFFVCLNKMFYERSLDVDDSGIMFCPVHLYIPTKILEITFLLRHLQFYIETLKPRKRCTENHKMFGLLSFSLSVC